MTTQTEMKFPPYPASPGHKRSGTSQDAAESIHESAATIRAMAYREIVEAGENGLTADECAGQLELSILSVRPRFSELARKDAIQDSGRRRRNVSGKYAIVWVKSETSQNQ